MSVYVVALLNITDREAYSQYEAGFVQVFQQHQGKLLSVDEAPYVVEGQWPFTRTVLLEFPDQPAFDAWYHSPQYQELMKHRLRASAGSIAVLQGVPAG